MRYQLINIVILISLLTLTLACGKDTTKLVPLEQCIIQADNTLKCVN